jgi:hypothetical protein
MTKSVAALAAALILAAVPAPSDDDAWAPEDLALARPARGRIAVCGSGGAVEKLARLLRRAGFAVETPGNELEAIAAALAAADVIVLPPQAEHGPWVDCPEDPLATADKKVLAMGGAGA